MNKFQAFLSRLSSLMALIVIPLALILAYFLYHNVFGNPANFEGGSHLNEPLKDNYLGIIYKGGPVVILLISFQLILITYAVERFIVIIKASGKGSNAAFVRKLKTMIVEGDTQKALDACDAQKGSVASVIRNGLLIFDSLLKDKNTSKNQKSLELQKELEEATQIELPTLNNNLVIISTLASISTLIGLLGTVTGMIKAFSALARVGAPDAVGLAAGISQALVTTALGISTAAVAIVLFNFFSTKIDNITQHIDEASFSIMHSLKTRA